MIGRRSGVSRATGLHLLPSCHRASSILIKRRIMIMATRIERDTLGEMEVPAEVYYGAQTARAVHNFPISGLKPHPAFVWAVVIIKKCAARANIATGRLNA